MRLDQLMAPGQECETILGSAMVATNPLLGIGALRLRRIEEVGPGAILPILSYSFCENPTRQARGRNNVLAFIQPSMRLDQP